jgi:hypothetical protein
MGNLFRKLAHSNLASRPRFLHVYTKCTQYWQADARAFEFREQPCLRRNEKRAAAASADVSVFPVPMETRKDLAVIAGNAVEMQEHSSNARHAKKQQKGDNVPRSCNGTRMFQNPTKTDQSQ